MWLQLGTNNLTGQFNLSQLGVRLCQSQYCLLLQDFQTFLRPYTCTNITIIQQKQMKNNSAKKES